MINLFSQPIYVDEFDCSLFDMDYRIDTKWASETRTSFQNHNKVVRGQDYLLKKLSDYTKQITKKPHEIYLKEVWANEYGKGEFQETHMHPFFHFSFVIFKDVPKDSGKFILYNPSLDFLYLYEDILEPYFVQKTWPLQEENTILIFPAYLKHMVSAGKNKKKRITYSGNFNIKITNTKIN